MSAHLYIFLLLSVHQVFSSKFLVNSCCPKNQVRAPAKDEIRCVEDGGEMKLVCTEPTIDVVFSALSYDKHILKVSDEEFKCQSSNKQLISVEDYYQEFNLTENLTLIASYPGTSEGDTIVHTFDPTQFCIAFNLVIEDHSARINETFRICVENEENDSVMVILKAENIHPYQPDLYYSGFCVYILSCVSHGIFHISGSHRHLLLEELLSFETNLWKTDISLSY